MASQADVVAAFGAGRGVFRARDVAALGVAGTTLQRMTGRGELVRVGRGLYSLPGAQVDDESIVLVAAARPEAVVCLLSALAFHGLTTQAPREVWVAIPSKAAAPRLEYPALRVVRFSTAALAAGVQVHVIGGVRVRVTSVAKTVVDCFKFRSTVGLDVALEALREAWSGKRATMDDLWRYASVCRVANVMRPYLEMLT